MSECAPVVLFVYRRPDHARQVVEALQANTIAPDTHLHVFSDAPKTPTDAPGVEAVRELVRNLTGFRRVTLVERQQNLGLARSIIDGVTQVLSDYPHVIVVEDDLVTSPAFLTFMNRGLDTYHARDDIISITGFSFPTDFMGFGDREADSVYLNVRPMSWTWATWHDRWNRVDWTVPGYNELVRSRHKIRQLNQGGTDLFDLLKLNMEGRVDSWYIRWAYHAFRFRLSTIYPTRSFVKNIGHDGTGVHCGSTTNPIFTHSELNFSEDIRMPGDIIIDQSIVNKFNRAFNIPLRSRVKQVVLSALGLRR